MRISYQKDMGLQSCKVASWHAATIVHFILFIMDKNSLFLWYLLPCPVTFPHANNLLHWYTALVCFLLQIIIWIKYTNYKNNQFWEGKNYRKIIHILLIATYVLPYLNVTYSHQIRYVSLDHWQLFFFIYSKYRSKMFTDCK